MAYGSGRRRFLLGDYSLSLLHTSRSSHEITYGPHALVGMRAVVLSSEPAALEGTEGKVLGNSDNAFQQKTAK